jgi:phage baseplate assembly protein W
VSETVVASSEITWGKFVDINVAEIKGISNSFKTVCTVKEGSRFSRHQTGCHLPNSLWAGIMQFFPAQGEFGE